ncbi:hypothetical protein MHYP_G00069360 [Metynnis hypsauchen]
MDQLFTLSRIVEGAREFANPVYMCFVDLEKAYDCVPQDILWEILQEYEVPGLLLQAIQSLYSQVSRRSWGKEGIVCHGRRVASLLFADDVVLLAGSHGCLQRSLEQFAGERTCLRWRSLSILVLFTSDGKRDREIGHRLGQVAAVMRSLYRTVVVKRELSHKAKLSVYWSVYIPTLTYGHDLWVMTERMRSQIQVAEMGFLRRVASYTLLDRVSSSE